MASRFAAPWNPKTRSALRFAFRLCFSSGSGFSRGGLSGRVRLRSFRSLGFSAGLLRGRFAATLRLLVARIVGFDELDQRHFGGIALALGTQFVDARVATVAVRQFV